VISCIVVGIDGSENGERALEWALDLGSAVDARVVAVHARGMLPEPSAEPSGWGDNPRVQQWEIDDGNPVDVMLRVVGHESAGLVVVGTRGRGGREGMFLGSTSHQLAERCPCPVVIVPPR
jgi:nucleotide-binding universal stress UspA family protein